MCEGHQFCLCSLWSDDSGISVPLSIQPVQKALVWNKQKSKEVYKALHNKNAVFRTMVRRLTRSKRVDYVLCDSWYSGKENMNYLVQECATNFIMALKINRGVARSQKEAKAGNFKPLQDMKLGKGAVKVYIKGVEFPLLVVKKVFKNEDGSSGTLYLATSNTELCYEQILHLYKRRWKIEEYHKSLKSNCSLGKCQAFSQRAQQSHFYLSALAFLLLEKAKAQKDKNQFALKKELNILTIKYGLKMIKKLLHVNTKNISVAA